MNSGEFVHGHLIRQGGCLSIYQKRGVFLQRPSHITEQECVLFSKSAGDRVILLTLREDSFQGF